MEENSEGGHSVGRWRALPAHEERREGEEEEEEVVRDGEEEEEIREGEGEKDSTVQDGSVNSRLLSSQPHPQPASSLWPTGIQSRPPPSSLHLLSSSLALICLLHDVSRTPHPNPIPGAGRSGPSPVPAAQG